MNSAGCELLAWMPPTRAAAMITASRRARPLKNSAHRGLLGEIEFLRACARPDCDSPAACSARTTAEPTKPRWPAT
jgi:hypothetical protein